MFSDTLNEKSLILGAMQLFLEVCVWVCVCGGGGGGEKKGQISTADCVFTLGPHVMNFLNFPMY